MTRVESKLRPDLWDRNAIAFIRARGLEGEFSDWCGGWPVPSAEALRAATASPAGAELGPGKTPKDAITPPQQPQEATDREGWVLVPREPTEEMIEAAESALTNWRKTLSPDEAMARSYMPPEGPRRFRASATPAEKHAIRYRAMLSAVSTPSIGGRSGNTSSVAGSSRGYMAPTDKQRSAGKED